MTHLDLLPPFICRAKAHHGRSGKRVHRDLGLSYTEIAERSGLHRVTVIRISKLTSWDSVPINTAFRFAAACGVNLLRIDGHLVRRAKRWRSSDETVNRLMTKWLSELAAFSRELSECEASGRLASLPLIPLPGLSRRKSRS